MAVLDAAGRDGEPALRARFGRQLQAEFAGLAAQLGTAERPQPLGGGAPGPSGGGPLRKAAWNFFSEWSSSAVSRPVRSPKRLKTVPLPTFAAAATASIVTPAAPCSATSRAAASSSRARLRAASARRQGSSSRGPTWSNSGCGSGSWDCGKGGRTADMKTA